MEGMTLTGAMNEESLLSTKYHVPAARPNAVVRARLLDHLEAGLRLERRLTLVSAPPGFGKTTLIREWVGIVKRRVAWLSLDEGDNDAARFVSYVRAAISEADEAMRQGLRAMSAAASPQELLVALINDLSRVASDLLLVIDDYHVISDYAVHRLLVFLLENQPRTLHLVIGTREDPPLPLARLRARDQLTEVRERALRFTSAEADTFLNQTMNLGLSNVSVSSLAARTEGWITGLQLAGLALREESAADAFTAAFAGDDRYIVDYLMAEVLERMSEPMRSFVRQTSILERLSAPLCDALLGKDDSQAMLEHLEAANLFLIPLDNRREWYRYHVLFADMLRLTLDRSERIALHEKAGGWFGSQGLGEFALYHARQAEELAATSAPSAHRARVQPLVEALSEREVEVLRLVAEGYSNAEIAQRLYITLGTVKTHINNAYGKLDVNSRTQAIAKARSLGLI